MDKRKLITFIILSVLVAGSAGFIWYKFYSCDETCRILTQDTYGGKTPQTTIDLLVDALKKEDVELASMYFAISEREKWAKTLQIFKDSGFLDEMAGDIERDPSLVELRLNEYSGVWKIVNFR